MAHAPIDIHQVSDEHILAQRDMAIAQMDWMRHYTLELMDTIPFSRWFEIPPGSSSNVAWQVGHLAVSEYGLFLFRQRGRLAEDRELMPSWLRKRFGRGSDPTCVASDTTSPQELLDHLDAIHQRSLTHAKQLSAATLREPIDMPYAVYATKLGALLFGAPHESIHAGQIGMIRRQLGLAPIR
ncbi:MAG: hypothetical protein KatS3mg111_1598 [Pirellulaceae bacterium]|nr:MAG: hypothetical protein KatS3mg111_1598 [Pirellulaceae bacterium]